MSVEEFESEFECPTANGTQIAAHRMAELLIKSRDDVSAVTLKHDFEKDCDRVSRNYPLTKDVGHDEWVRKCYVSLGAFLGNGLFEEEVAEAFTEWVVAHDDYAVNWEFDDDVLATELFPDGALLIECEKTGTWWAAVVDDQAIVPVGISGPAESAAEEYGEVLYSTGSFKRPQGDPLREHC